ncbi:MAG: DUF3108 domain-containing protein [Gemmatimonadota bacterium]
MKTRHSTVALSAAALVGLASSPLAAQSERDLLVDSLRSAWPVTEGPVSFTADQVDVDPFAARAPFGPGEHLVYKVKVGIFGVGEGYMAVTGVEDHGENPSYQVEMSIQGSLGPAKVNDFYQSWLDVTTLQTWRYVRDVSQVGYSSYRHWEFFPDRMRWERQDNDEAGDLGSALPLDEIAFIYFIRTLPLEVGKSYTFNRYFKDDGNPVTVRVLRKDERETEGVRYNTIVVAPEIQTSNLFAEGGGAEIHLTDDDRRIPVYVKSDLPGFPGSLTLHLRSIQSGHPLHPESRERLERAAETAQGPEGR